MAEFVEDESSVNFAESIEQNGLELKEEFGTSIQAIIDKLVEKREEVFNRIDDFVKQGREDVKRKENEVEQIHKIRRSISNEMERSTISNKMIESLDVELSTFKQKIPTFKIKWNYSVSKLVESISKLAEVEKYYERSYTMKDNPIWTGITQGKGDMELVKPGGIAVDLETSDIFVGDRASAKILVFTQHGEYIRFFHVQNKYNMISKLCVFKNSLFFISEVLQTPLYKVRKDNGMRIVKQVFARKLNKITMDHSGNVFLCNDSELILFSCNVELGNSKQMKLTSPYLKGNMLHVTRLLDIKIFAKAIYCLFNNTEIPIHVYTRGGEYIRPIHFIPTPLKMNVNLVSMYIDKNGNILVNFGGKYEGIRIYNPEGGHIADIGKHGKGEGEMIEPREVVVVGNNQAVIISNANPLNMLVAY